VVVHRTGSLSNTDLYQILINTTDTLPAATEWEFLPVLGGWVNFPERDIPMNFFSNQ
jgi:hypothetical protein